MTVRFARQPAAPAALLSTEQVLLTQRLRAFEGALALHSALPPMASVQAVCDRAATLLVSSLGFERVMLFAAQEGRLAVMATRFSGSARWANHCHAFAAANPIELADGRMEREVLYRGVGAYARDAMRDPHTAHPITSETRTDSYVSVPIVADGRLLGVANADLHFSGRPVGEGELDAAIVFAEALGTAWARAEVVEQLQDLHGRLAMALDVSGGHDMRPPSSRVQPAFADSGLALDVEHAHPDPAASPPGAGLTARELDVVPRDVV